MATYSGDTNYVASVNSCGDPQETPIFSAMSPLMSRPAVVRTNTTWIGGDRHPAEIEGLGETSG